MTQTERIEQSASAYAAAGVDVDANDRLIPRYRDLARTATRPEQLGDVGAFSGAVRTVRIPTSGVGRVDGRRRHKGHVGQLGRSPRWSRPGSGQPLHQRHPLRRSGAAVLPRLPRRQRVVRRRQGRCGVRRGCRLPRQRDRTARRGDRRHARPLSSRSLRPGRHDRRRARTRPGDHRRIDRAGRHRTGIAEQRTAYERLLVGPPGVWSQTGGRRLARASGASGGVRD